MDRTETKRTVLHVTGTTNPTFMFVLEISGVVKELLQRNELELHRIGLLHKLVELGCLASFTQLQAKV